MASSSGFVESTVVKPTHKKRDLAWRYNHLKDPNNKNQVTCNFCLLTSSGGITRAWRHQLGIPGDVAACSNTPADVKVLLQADLDKKKRRKQVLEEVRAQVGDDVHHDVAEIRGTQNGNKPAEPSLQAAKKKRDRMSKMSAEEWKAYLLAARQKITQPSTANTGQQLILHAHGEDNKGGKGKEKVKIGSITLLVPSCPSEPNGGVDVTSSTVMATDNPDADSPPNDKDVPLPKRAKTGKDESKKKRIVSSKGPTKSSEAVAPPSGGPSKPSAAASGAAVCSTTTNSLWDSSFNPVNFVKDKLKSAEDIDRIQSLSIDEARSLMLSYGLKAMLVGNVVTERQAKDLQAAQSKLTIADETLVEVQTKLEEVTENFKKEAKARAELDDKRKEDIEKLKKDHEDEIKMLKQEYEKKNRALSNKNSNMMSSLTTKDKTLKELTKEKETWADERKHHDDVVHELKLDQASMFQKGFDLALEQVKILFPDLDAAILGEADSLKNIVDGKLVS